MKNITQWIITAAFLIFLNSCANSADDNFFYVKHKGAEMPVWVKGNTASKTFVLFIHGGPGGTGLYMQYLPEFQKLQNDYALVYWDQRNSGNSQGNPDPSTFTMTQFVEDTQVIIEAVKSQYTVNSLFVMGHSWGGQLGSAYMASSSRDPLVKGWMDVDGGIGFSRQFSYSRTWILNKIPTLLADSSLDATKRKTLEEGLSWYQNNDTLYQSGDSMKTFADKIVLHAKYVTAAGGYEYKEGITQEKISTLPILDPIMPLDMLAFISTQSGLIYNFPESEINVFSNDVDLSQITVPTLYLWGRHDGIIPVELGQYKFSKLTSIPDIDKSMVIFESSAHSPFLEEGDKFYTEVNNFISKYRSAS